MNTCLIIKQNKLSEDQELLLSKMMKAAGIENYQIINSLFYNVPTDSDIYIAFGADAALSARQKSLDVIELPSLFLLTDTNSNRENRELAWAKLQKIKQHTEVVRILKEDPLPKWTASEILKLQNLPNNSTGITIFSNK